MQGRIPSDLVEIIAMASNSAAAAATREELILQARASDMRFVRGSAKMDTFVTCAKKAKYILSVAHREFDNWKRV